MIRDLKIYYTNALFAVTGAAIYYVFFGIPSGIIGMYVCGDNPIERASEPCQVVFVILGAIAILGLPIGCAQFHKTGKWFWTSVLHVFPKEAS
jgi:hypothetical protein